MERYLEQCLILQCGEVASKDGQERAMGQRLKGKALKAAIFGEQEQLDKANAARDAGEQIDVKPL